RISPQVDDCDGRVLRFHPSCPYHATRHPCLLALMRDVRTNEPRAIQRTALLSQRTASANRTVRNRVFLRRALTAAAGAGRSLSRRRYVASRSAPIEIDSDHDDKAAQT